MSEFLSSNRNFFNITPSHFLLRRYFRGRRKLNMKQVLYSDIDLMICQSYKTSTSNHKGVRFYEPIGGVR